MKLLDLIPEALGVPKDLLKVNKEIYDRLLAQLELKKDTPLGRGYFPTYHEFSIPGPFKIGDFLLKDVDAVVSIVRDRGAKNPDFLGASVISPHKADKGYNRLVRSEESIPRISIMIEVPIIGYENFGDILDYFKNNTKLMSVLAHELKHDFDSFKNKKGLRTKDAADYQAKAGLQTGIAILDRFFYNLYLTSFTETLVLPTEFAAKLEYNNITKKDFLKELKEEGLYKKLKDAKEMTYEKIYSDIKKAVEDSERMGFNITFDSRLLSKYLNRAYEIYRKNISDYLFKVKNKIKNDIDNLGPINYMNEPDIFDSLTKTIPKIEQSLSKYKDGESFIKAETKKMNRDADAALRKLAKVYALLPDEPDKKSVFNKADTFKEKRTDLLSKKQSVK